MMMVSNSLGQQSQQLHQQQQQQQQSSTPDPETTPDVSLDKYIQSLYLFIISCLPLFSLRVLLDATSTLNWIVALSNQNHIV